MIYTLFLVLIILAAVLMIGIVLIQESKGGGLSSNFSSSNAIMGVRKTTDFVASCAHGPLLPLSANRAFLRTHRHRLRRQILTTFRASAQASNRLLRPLKAHRTMLPSKRLHRKRNNRQVSIFRYIIGTETSYFRPICLFVLTQIASAAPLHGENSCS